MFNPQYVKIGDKKYKINTGYREALKCDEIIKDNSIGEYEKTLAIICILFGREGLKDRKNHNKLIELAYKYLSCGEEPSGKNNKPDMDFEQDFKLIRASFKNEYNIDLLKENIDWWDFWTYINGLTDACVLNKVRELRDYDVSSIKDIKERQKIIEAQRYWALKENKKSLTKDQIDSINRFYEQIGMKVKEG